MFKKNKKHLLEEGVATRFMGLAGIGSLSDQFVQKKYGKKTLREFDKAEELDEVVTDEDLNGRQTEKGARLSEMPEDEMNGNLPPEDDEPMDEPMDEPEGGLSGDVDVESLVTALADVIETHTGVPVDVEGAEDNEAPMDDLGDDSLSGDDYGADMGDEEMMEASEALKRAGYALDEKTGKYYKKKGMYEGEEDEQLSENKGKEVKETKKVQKEGEKEELDEEAQELKSQMPNDPGKVKTGKTERVKGAEKPGPVESSHPDHTLKNGPKPDLKTLEERVMKRVLTKLKEELVSRKSRGSKKK